MNKVAIIDGTGRKVFDFKDKTIIAADEIHFCKAISGVYSVNIDSQELLLMEFNNNVNILPANKVNYRTNISNLKGNGCKCILSVSTCLSLQEEICPGELIIPDQFIDLSGNQPDSDFIIETDINNKGLAEPFSSELRDHLTEAAIVLGITVHTKGTAVSLMGPRMPTRAESGLYKKSGGDFLDFTTAHEVIAANERNIPYARISLCTGYDAWRNNFNEPFLIDKDKTWNKLTEILMYAIKRISDNGDC